MHWQLKWGSDTVSNGSPVQEWQLACVGLHEDGPGASSGLGVGVGAGVGSGSSGVFGGTSHQADAAEVLYTGPDTRFDHNKLRPGRSFVYRVRARNALGWSAWSDDTVGAPVGPGTRMGA